MGPNLIMGLLLLIDAIASGGPKVIGVDLDTASETFQQLRTPEHWPPIVWGQGVKEKDHHFELLPVLGGQKLNRASDHTGIAALPQDSDGVVRRYVREFPVMATGSNHCHSVICCVQGRVASQSTFKGY